MRVDGRIVGKVAMMVMMGGVVREAVVVVVLRELLRITIDRRDIERQIVVIGVVLWLLGSGGGQRELGGTSGDVGRRGRRSGGSYG